MKELFEQSPLYRGCHSVARCSKPGPLIPKDAARFWLPLIMAFTGARLEEICQLRVSDVKEQDGVSYLHLQDGEDQHLKSKAARRLVPIHSILVRCGLLAFIGKQRQAEAEWLFGDLVPQGPDRKRGGALSKWFPLYRRAALKGCPTSRLEDFRATFKTRLLNDGAPGPLVDEILGHEQEGMDAHYYKGAEHIGQLRDVVERCRYDGLDLSHLFET